MSKPEFHVYKENTYDKACFVSKYTYSWMWKFLIQNYNKELKVHDLYTAPKDSRCFDLGDKLEKYWNIETKKNRPSLINALNKVFFLYYTWLGLVGIIFCCIIQVLEVSCLRNLIFLLINPEKNSKKYIFSNVSGIIIFQFIYVILQNYYFFQTFRMGMKIRIACCNLIYRKSLRLSQDSINKTPINQLINLLTNDVNRFDLSLVHLQFTLIGFLQLIIIWCILWKIFYWPSTIGIILLIIYIPVQFIIGRKFLKIKSSVSELTEERFKKTNEFLSSIKLIKMNRWEKIFSKLISLFRRKEIKIIRQSALFKGFNLGIYFISTKIIVFVILLVHVLFNDGNLQSSDVFACICFINQLKTSVTLYLPYGFSSGAEAFISAQNIQNFLFLKEKQSESLITNKQSNENSKNLTNQDVITEENEEQLKEDTIENNDKISNNFINKQNFPIIQAINMFSSWNFDSDCDFTLKDISFEIKQNQLFSIIGQNGSGKTSLLMTLLNELPIIKGKLNLNGVFSYSSQNPWNFPGTIRENIIFGKPFNLSRYRKVIKACGLRKDIEQLPFGDRTFINERGDSLTIGQRAKVNLARAIYFDVDIYLLDEPLSLLENNTALSIFNKCIKNYLKEKIVVLVTNQPQFIKLSDKILFLKDGSVAGYGDYKTINNQLVDFLKNQQEDVQVINLQSITSSNLSLNETEDSSVNNITNILNTATSDTESIPGTPILSRFNRRISFKRQSSKISDVMPYFTESFDDEGDEELSNQVNNAENFYNDITMSNTYLVYLSACKSYLMVFFVFILFVITQVAYTGSEYWLSCWTNSYDKNQTFSYKTYKLIFRENYLNILIYSITMVLVLVFSITRTLAFFYTCMSASVRIHDKLIDCLVKVPIFFFEASLISLFLNRYSKDINIIDNILPATIYDAVSIGIMNIGSVILIVYLKWDIIFATLFLFFCFYLICKLYVGTARNIKTLESLTRSSIISHFLMSQQGLIIIRAFKVEPTFEKLFNTKQDCHSAAWFAFLSSSRWFSLVLDVICSLFVAFVTISLTFYLGYSNANLVALGIASAINFAGDFQWGMRQMIESQTQITSVQRIDEFSKLKSESEFNEVIVTNKPPENWPSLGEIVFENVSLSYKPIEEIQNNFEDADLFNKNYNLKNLKFRINGGEKIGIFGKTGAGKSSVLAALFRLVEPSGSIFIDHIDTKLISINDLRKKISVVHQEQDPFLNTIRQIIDPFEKFSEEEIWKVLDEVQLKEVISTFPEGLSSEISNKNQLNFSHRILLSLARAMLVKNKILVIEEISDVDIKLDLLLHQIIQKFFKDSTVLTLSSKINSVIDKDKVIVLENGKLIEFDTPYNLTIKNPSTLFNSLLKATGKENFRYMKKLILETNQGIEIEENL